MGSLPYERGRVAFKAVSRVFEELTALAAEPPLELPSVSDHYAAESRDALHHLERSLFADSGIRKRKHGDAVRLPCRRPVAGGPVQGRECRWRCRLQC